MHRLRHPIDGRSTESYGDIGDARIVDCAEAPEKSKEGGRK